MSAPADAHCGSMPCDTGLLLNAIATRSGSAALPPSQRTKPATGSHVFGARADRAGPPRPVRIITTVPWLRRVPAYFLAYGALRERPPAESLR